MILYFCSHAPKECSILPLSGNECPTFLVCVGHTWRLWRIYFFLLYLPGSGKSYLAKILRDLEVENGGDAPRIHSMDDYFMTEVEKVCLTHKHVVYPRICVLSDAVF